MKFLYVDPPYHFGWKTKDNERDSKQIPIPDGTHQKVDLEKRLGDITLYRNKQEVGWFKMIPKSQQEII